MSNCKHETSVVTCTIESLGLTQMICTWQCQKPFWMLQTGLTTKEIQNEVDAALQCVNYALKGDTDEQ